MPQQVLVIDDSDQVHQLISVWLKNEPVETQFASTAVKGHAAAVALRPDLILLDVDMPDMSGFDLCRLLKSDEALCRVPVIFLTGAHSPSDRVAGLNLGAVDYIIKPFHPAEFQARVRAALRTKYLLDLLAHRAHIDGLTGLHNRAHLDEQLSIEVAKLRRHPGKLACVMADVDHFKSINDTHGHATGDQVLKQVAEVLQSVCREEDIVGRYGGEEFTILTPGVDAEGATALAERARQAIAALSVRCGGQAIRVTSSFGVAEVDFADASRLIEHADAALYHAKTNGRDRVERFREGMTRTKRHAA